MQSWPLGVTHLRDAAHKPSTAHKSLQCTPLKVCYLRHVRPPASRKGLQDKVSKHVSLVDLELLVKKGRTNATSAIGALAYLADLCGQKDKQHGRQLKQLAAQLVIALASRIQTYTPRELASCIGPLAQLRSTANVRPVLQA
eukprot:jgi/Chrzof1/2517/Cz11g18160.t1